MKKQDPTSDIINPHNFKNPICQETFDSLPRIYGSIKNRIMSNKAQFYEQLNKQSFPRYSRSKQRSQHSHHQRSQNSNENRSSTKKTNKLKLSKEHKEELEVKGMESRKNKANGKVAYFSDKYNKLKPVKKQLKIERIKQIKTDDRESNHKVKFNTMHFMLPSIRSVQHRGQRPETLSDLIDEKLTKSLSLNNPLMHLYKSRKNIDVSNRYEIKQQNDEDESRKATIIDKYMPKQIRKSIHSKKDDHSDKEKGRKPEKFKTQPSEKHSFSSNKYSGVQTQFSKRLAREINVKQGSHLIQNSSTKFRIPTQEQYKIFIESYRPTNPGFSFKMLLQKETFEIISYDTGVYFGQYNGRHRQGLGVMVTEDWVFEGYFDKDKKTKGTELTYDGVYRGRFNETGQRDGKGRFEWNNGELYEGGWREGKKHGQGIWKSPEGDSYQGQWQKGRQHGKGTHKHKASTYKGEFLNSLKHGHGQQQFLNGDKYKGMYEKGKPHGVGRYDWSDGSYYQGDFVAGYREGRGVLYEYNGCFYRAKAVSGGISSTGLGNKLTKTDKNTKEISRKGTESTVNPQNSDCCFIDSKILIDN